MRKAFIFKLFFLLLLFDKSTAQSYVSFSFDDPYTKETPLLTWQERSDKLLQTLNKYHLKTTLYVCGHRVNDKNGEQLVGNWNKNGHSIANHSFSHESYNSPKISYQFLKNDFLKNDKFIAKYSNYTRLFRFPFLKEGETKAKRDSMRNLLRLMNYKNGYVSIDASDWYIDSEIINLLRTNPKADLTPYKEFYVQHILERANFYDSLAFLLTGRKVKHVLLLHQNLLNALFLEDLIKAFQQKNWKLINTKEAYQDAIYSLQPNIIPAGESIIWAMAKESGKHESALRYPAEDSIYEEKKLAIFLKNKR